MTPARQAVERAATPPVERAAASPTASPVAVRSPGDVLYARDLYAGPGQGITVVDAGTGAVVRRLPWGVPSPDWSVVYRASAVYRAEGLSSTVLRVLDAATGATLREHALAGPHVYESPVLGPLGDPIGLSPNGQWLALRASGVRSAFLVVAATPAASSARVESTALALDGDFSFDALSSAGTTLYLEEHLPPGRPIDGYRIRAYDLNARSLVPGAIVDKSGTGGRMSGQRVAALPSGDGTWLHSLYVRYDGSAPFVHALNLAERWAVCLFLPTAGKGGTGEEQFAWTLAAGSDGRKAYVVNTLAGVVTELDLREPKLGRTATFAVASADEPSPLEVLARPLGAVARWFMPIAAAKSEMSSTAVVSPDGTTLYAVGDFGRAILAISTSTLAVGWRIRPNTEGIVGLGVSPDGARLYATTAESRTSVGSILRIDAASGSVLGSASAPAQVGRILRVASR